MLRWHWTSASTPFWSRNSLISASSFCSHGAIPFIFLLLFHLSIPVWSVSREPDSIRPESASKNNASPTVSLPLCLFSQSTGCDAAVHSCLPLRPFHAHPPPPGTCLRARGAMSGTYIHPAVLPQLGNFRDLYKRFRFPRAHPIRSCSCFDL